MKLKFIKESIVNAFFRAQIPTAIVVQSEFQSWKSNLSVLKGVISVDYIYFIFLNRVF